MARPSKSVNIQSSHLTKDEQNKRKTIEKALLGELKTPILPPHLNKNQSDIFNFVVEKMSPSEILGELDTYILTMFSVAVERIWYIDSLVNETPELLHNSKFMSSRDRYVKDFMRCCSELCMSPQSRAKMSAAISTAAKNKEDLLINALKQGGNEIV